MEHPAQVRSHTAPFEPTFAVGTRLDLRSFGALAEKYRVAARDSAPLMRCEEMRLLALVTSLVIVGGSVYTLTLYEFDETVQPGMSY